MIRSLALILAVLSLLIIFPMGKMQVSAEELDADTVRPVVRVENKTVHRGQTFEIEIYLDQNPGLIALTLDLEYDKTVMELVDVKRGEALGSHTFSTSNTETEDGFLITPFRMLWDGRGQDASTGVIVTLTFQSKVDAEIGDYPVTVSYDRDNTNADYGKPSDVEIQNGCVTLIKGAYSVKYLNYDGTVLFENDYNEDGVPAYVGETPTRPDDKYYLYEFKGWRGVVSDTPNVICYVADYRLIPQIYQVFFYVDGEYFHAMECPYGTFVDMSNIPSKKNYVFDGWYTDEDLTARVSSMQMPAENLVLYGQMKFNVRENPIPEITLAVDRIEQDYVYVTVDVTKNPSISGLVLTLNYDRAALTFEGFERGDAFSILQFDHTNTDRGYAADPFRFYWEHSSNTLETGRLLTLKFKINENAADGVYDITMTYDPTVDAVYIDENGKISYTKLNIIGAKLPLGEIYYWNEKIVNVADVVVECHEGMPVDTELRIEVATASLNISNEVIKALIGSNMELKAAYTVELVRNNVKVQPKGTITVRIKLTDAQLLCSDLRVYYVDKDKNMFFYESTVEDGYIVFETDHLSNWAIIGNVLDAPTGVGGASTPANSHIIIIAFALLAIACMSFCLIMIAQKKNWMNSKSHKKGENNT